MLITPPKKKIKPLTAPSTHTTCSTDDFLSIQGKFSPRECGQGERGKKTPVLGGGQSSPRQCRADLDGNWGMRMRWGQKKGGRKSFLESSILSCSASPRVSRWRVNTSNSYLPSFLSSFSPVFGLSHIKKPHPGILNPPKPPKAPIRLCLSKYSN